jgi:hypothetical protein
MPTPTSLPRPDAPPSNSAPSSTTADADELPVPAEDVREYIQVTPTDASLRADSAATYFKRLHGLTTPDDAASGRSRLLSLGSTRESPPTIECLLHSDRSREQPLTYWFGVDDPEATSALERILRGVFPDSYEFERRVIQPGYLESIIRGKAGTDHATTDRTLRAVEYEGTPTRTRDWQTQLAPFESFQNDEESRVPLASVVETMSAHQGPIVYQVLLQPKPDWTADAEERRMTIELHSDTLGERLANTVFGAPDPTEEPALTPTDETRLAELETKDTRHSFVLTARLVGSVAAETTAEEVDAATFRELEAAFTQLDRTTYEVDGERTSETGAEQVLDDLLARTVYPPETGGLSNRLPWRSAPPRGIVADVHEAPSFCLVGGSALTTAGERALSTTPGERAPVPRPGRLSRFRS